jgi:hypothetical protein
MRYNDTNSWDTFVYSLIYPGFLGSMIYEIIPSSNSAADLLKFWTLATLIKILITLLYCLDYLHLYADMEKVAAKQKSGWYVWCDILVSFYWSALF